MQLPRPQQFTAKLQEKRQVAPKYIHFTFELSEPYQLSFVAGQYVSIRISENGARRSYSICSSPAIEHGFELLVDVSHHGLGTTYLENVQLGESVQVLAPLGSFCIENTAETARYCIATGSGIAPFRSMILDELQVKNDPRPLTLYWGLRHEEDLFWGLEFQELAKNFPQFKSKIILSQPREDWPLDKGRVTDLLTALEKPVTAGYYLCGNTAMVHESLDILAAAQIPGPQIHHEKFF